MAKDQTQQKRRSVIFAISNRLGAQNILSGSTYEVAEGSLEGHGWPQEME